MVLLGTLSQVLRRGPILQAVSVVLLEVDAAGDHVLSLLEEALARHVDHPIISGP